MSSILPLGLSIDTDIDSKTKRASDPRGFIDNDIPLLESFLILKDNKPPEDFYLSPDDYRTFIDWLLEGTIEPPVPSIPLKILCYYRTKLAAGMKDVGTTDGNRLYQENIIKTINKLLNGGDESSDPTTICATGGAAQAAPPPESECCEEIKPKIDAIAESIEELKTKQPFDLRVELKKILDGSHTEPAKAEQGESKDYTEKLEEIKHLIESQKPGGCDTAKLEEKLEEVKHLIESQKPGECDTAKLEEKLDSLNTVVTQNMATEIGELNEKVTSILEILGQARGNISKLLSKGPVGKSGLEIKAALITEKAAQASAEADKALAELDLIKKNATKTEEDIEASIDKATNSRNKADKLITEAQQLWELIEPSTNNSSSQEKGPEAPAAVVAQPPEGKEEEPKPPRGPDVLPVSGEQGKGAETPQAVVVNPVLKQRGGRGSDKNHEVIDSAKVKLNALTASVADAKEIIKKRRSTKGNSAKNVEIAELRAKIAAYEQELAEFKKVGKDGAQIGKAMELEAKVRTLTELITSITGPSENLAKAVANHKAADNKASDELKGLQTKLAGIPDLEGLKTKLAGALEKISILEQSPDTSVSELTPELGEELKTLRIEVETARMKHVSDEETSRGLKEQLETLRLSLKDLQSKYDKLVDENERAKDELEKTLAKIASLEASNTSGKNSDELASLREKLTEKIAEVERITVEKAACHKELTDNKGSLTELRGSLAGKQSEFAGLEKELDALKSEKAALEKRLAAMEGDTTNKNALARLQGELETASKKIAELTEKKGQLEANISRKDQKATEDAAEIGRLTKELADLKALYEPLKQEHEKITAKLSEVNASLAAITGERDKLTGKISELDAQIAALESDDKDKEELQGKLSGLTEEREELKRRAEKAESELEALKGDKSGLLSRVEKAERELAAVRLELQEKNAELSTISGEASKKDEKISALDTQLQAALRDAAEQKRLAESTRAEIEAIKSQKATIERRISELEAELSGLRGKNSDALGKIKMALERATTEKGALDEQLLVLRDSEKMANKRANIAEGEARKCSEREAATQKQLQEALAELEALSQRCSGLNLLQSQLATWKKQVAEKLEEISILKQQKSGDSGRASQLETEIRRLQGQMAGQALAHTKETEQITGQLKRAQAEIASLTSQLSQSEASARLSSDAERQIEAIRAQCAEREEHLQSLLRGRTVTEAVAREPEVIGKTRTSSYMNSTAASRGKWGPGGHALKGAKGGTTVRKKGARLAKTKKNISPLI